MPKLSRIIDLDLELPQPPYWLVVVLMFAVVLSWVPLALIALTRVTLSDRPAIHLIQDMDVQPKVTAQQSSVLFADGRAMRPPVPGTIARGELELDDHYYRGFRLTEGGEDGRWQATYFDGLPDEVEADMGLLQRGQERYNIYCFPCHGLDGSGEGPVHQRAVLNMEPAWVPPTNLAEARLRPGQYEDGRLFSVISNGIRNMPAYASQIEVHDRWAIVAYVRALQLSQPVPQEPQEPAAPAQQEQVE